MKRLANIIIIILIIVSVFKLNVEAASLNKGSLSLKIGDTYKLKVSGGKVTKWTSSMPGVASVKKGEVKALNVGSTIITAKTSKGNVKCKVTVKQTSKIKYNNTKYKVDNKFKKGFYVLYSNSDIEKASYSIYKGAEVSFYDIISNDQFEYNRIVYLDVGQTLYMENCYAVSMKQAIVRTSGIGTFKVGTHIKAGTYNLESINGSELIMCTVSSDWNSNNVTEYIKMSNNSKKTVKIKNGQYVTLVGCKLKKKL